MHITDIKAGDIFYMCSDGMLEQMGDEELVDVLCCDMSWDEDCRFSYSGSYDVEALFVEDSLLNHLWEVRHFEYVDLVGDVVGRIV